MPNVRVNGSGKLFFDFYYRKIRCREYTLLNDTAANRRLMEQKYKQIEKEISAGTFSYRRYFPSSQRANLFEPAAVTVAPMTSEELVNAAAAATRSMGSVSGATSAPVGVTPLFTDFADKWYEEREVDWKRSTRLKVADILRKHLIPRFKGRRVGEISKEDVLSLRNHLDKDYRDGCGLSNSRINGILNVLRQVLDEGGDRYGFASPIWTIARRGSRASAMALRSRASRCRRSGRIGKCKGSIASSGVCSGSAGTTPTIFSPNCSTVRPRSAATVGRRSLYKRWLSPRGRSSKPRS